LRFSKGRAEPQTVAQGDWVYTGSRVLKGTLEVLTEKHGDETSLRSGPTRGVRLGKMLRPFGARGNGGR